MAKKFLVNIDLSGNQLLSARIQNGVAAPTVYGAGQLWYDTTNNQLNVYNGSASAFQPLTTGGTSVSSLNGFTGGVSIYGTASQITVTPTTGSIVLSLPSTVSMTTACATNFYGTFNGTITNALQLNGVAASAYALLSSANFTAASVGGNAIATQTFVTTSYAPLASPTFTGTVNLGTNTATGSVSYATNAGNATTTSQTNFSALTISSSAVATQAYVGTASVADSAKLGGTVAASYALLSSANFTAASVGGSRITTVADKLNAHAATTSAELAGVISDETGSGSLVFNTSPSFVTPNIGNATGSVTYATSAGTVTGATSTNTNSAYVVRDANGRAQFTDPSAAQDAATKNYVDSVAQGLNTHDSVLVTTTTNLSATYTNGALDASTGSGIGALLTSTANGTLTIDTVLVNVNDRILVKNQSTGLQNGIYTVTASGAAGASWVLTRTSDGDNSIAGEMSNGDFIFVTSGSVGAGTGWALNSSSTSGTPTKSIKLGTDIVTYTQFSGQGTYTAGNGMSISGNTFSVNAASTGGIQALAGGVSILKPTNSGLITDSTGLYIGAGTGFTLSGTTLNYSTGTTTQTAPNVSGGTYAYNTQKQFAVISGSTGGPFSFAINHNIGSRDVQVQVYQASTTPDTQYAEIEVDIVRTSTSVVTVSFASAPSTGNNYNVVIIG